MLVRNDVIGVIRTSAVIAEAPERLAGDGSWIRGFAAWHASLYARDRSLAAPSAVTRARAEYFELPRAADVPLAAAGPSAPDAVVRGKGSAAPDMVRLIAGDRAFFEGITDLFRGPIGPPMPVSGVQNAVEKRLGRRLSTAFSQWFDRADVPELEAELRTFPASTGGWRVDLSVVQRRAVYQMPVEVRLLGAGERHGDVRDGEGE